MERKWKVGEKIQPVSWWMKMKSWVLKKTFQGFVHFAVHKTDF